MPTPTLQVMLTICYLLQEVKVHRHNDCTCVMPQYFKLLQSLQPKVRYLHQLYYESHLQKGRTLRRMNGMYETISL
ncbi:hypothetical protein PMAYCL1PPCAC_19903, partial [Pristionchus mayeri]